MLSGRYKDLEFESLLKIKSKSLLRVTESLLRVDRDFNESTLSQKITYLTAN